jgi:hypothetical protein
MALIIAQEAAGFYHRLLKRFSNTYTLTNSVECGFFLGKKPLGGVLSVYSN